MPGLDLEKLLDESQDENQEGQEQTQETTETQEQETTESQEETTQEKTEETDPWAGKTEGVDFFTLSDGSKVSSQEMRDGYMRQEDYTNKTTEVAEIRRQLNLASTARPAEEEAPVDTKAINLEEQNASMSRALAEMDADDPQRVIYEGLIAQNNALATFINDNQQASAEATRQSNAANMKAGLDKVFNDALDTEVKSYNLPEVGGTKTEGLWRTLMLSELQKADTKMTLPEFQILVNQTGKKVYKQLRELISAANVKDKLKSGDDEGTTSGEKTKGSKTSDQRGQDGLHSKANAKKPKTLHSLLDAATDALGWNKQVDD